MICTTILRARQALGVLVLSILAPAALAIPATAAEPAARQTVREGTPVKVANRPVIILRGPVAGYTAKERATATMERIDQALAAERLPAVSLEESDVGMRVLLGGNRVFTVLKIDVDEDAGETVRLVAQEAVKRLESAIRERREQQTPRYLGMATARAAAATLIYGVLLWLLFRGSRWVRRWRSAAAHSATLKVGGVQLLDTGNVLILMRRVLTLAAWIIAFTLATGWLTFVLVQFPFTRPWGEDLEGNLLDIFGQILLAITEAMPGLLLVAVIILLARAVIRVAAAFFRRVEDGKVKLEWIDADTARPTQRILNIIIWVFALAMAYP